jgi:hypothetical protein
MKYTYEIPLDPFGKPSETSILRSDGAYIPVNESNADYQRYLRWLENPDAEENGTIS